MMPERAKAAPGEARRFLEAVIADPPPDRCVDWPFMVGTQGYGRIRHEGKVRPASRVALTLFEGPPPTDGMHAAHAPGICHNTLCVNPLHLRWATPADNIADRRIDGTHLENSVNPNAKLTTEAVVAIRQDGRPQHEIARAYGISRRSVYNICRRKTWAWLE